MTSSPSALLRARARACVPSVLLLGLVSACSYTNKGDGRTGDGGSFEEAGMTVDDGGTGPDGDTTSPGDSSASGGTTVGPNGGTVTSGDGNATLSIPAGALAESITFSIAPTTVAPAGALGTVYVLNPEGTHFAVPVELDIAYDSALFSGSVFSELAVATAANGGWEPQVTSIVDTQLHIAAALISHLSTWSIVVNAVPATSCSCTGQNESATKQCCESAGGTVEFDGSVCGCTGSTDPSSFAACVTNATGGSEGRAVNFSNSCISSCCSSYSDTANPNAFDTCVSYNGSLHKVADCVRGCVTTLTDATWSVCAIGSDVTTPDAGLDASVDASFDAGFDSGFGPDASVDGGFGFDASADTGSSFTPSSGDQPGSCSAPPGGPTCSPGSITCGGAICPVPGSTCCTSSTTGASVCQVEGATCAGAAFSCNEAGDCTGNDACCISAVSTANVAASCQPLVGGQCPSGGLISAQLCRSSAECAIGTCEIWSCDGIAVEACTNPNFAFCTIGTPDAGK